MRDIDKINRQVQFMFAQIFNSADTTGKNNTFQYKRAPDGYKFLLHSVYVSTTRDANFHNGIFEMSDGHYYTHWNIWPGVENREVIARRDFNDYALEHHQDLNLWECKEYTLAIRSRSEEVGFKCCIIVWYYLKSMNVIEKLFYAVIQPRFRRFKKAYATTLSRFEE